MTNILQVSNPARVYDNLQKYPKSPTAADFMTEDPDSPLVDKSKYLCLCLF